MQFCRQVLGVQKNTTNCGVLFELGLTPLILEAQRLSLKNWNRIKDGNGNSLLTSSYLNAKIKELDWNQTICNTLRNYEMQYRITESGPDLGNAYLGKAKDISHQESFAQIVRPDSKLRTYALIKQNIGQEEYLTKIKNTKQRQKLTKLRLSNHPLRIETGRHEKPKLNKNERIYASCVMGVEDEIHFVTKCPLFHDIRAPLFEACIELKPQFNYYSDEEKFVLAMTTPTLMGNVSNFVTQAFRERETIFDVHTTMNEILNKVCKSKRKPK